MQRSFKVLSRRGAVTGRTLLIYILLWALGVPGLLLVAFFLFGVGR